MPPLVATDKICPHGKSGKNKFHCKECPGKGICSHGQKKYLCMECPGKGICSHGKKKYWCRECPGNGICSWREQTVVQGVCRQGHLLAWQEQTVLQGVCRQLLAWQEQTQVQGLQEEGQRRGHKDRQCGASRERRAHLPCLQSTPRAQRMRESSELGRSQATIAAELPAGALLEQAATSPATELQAPATD